MCTSSGAGFFHDGKGRCSRAVERALQQGIMLCAQNSHQITFCSGTGTRQSLHWAAAGKGRAASPPPRCLQYCALRNRQALFQSSICCLELSPELYLFLFFHCFRRRQQTRVTMLRITTRAKLEMIEMITVMEYVGEKGGGGGGTCGVSPFGFLVPTGNDAVMQTKSEGYACARL